MVQRAGQADGSCVIGAPGRRLFCQARLTGEFLVRQTRSHVEPNRNPEGIYASSVQTPVVCIRVLWSGGNELGFFQQVFLRRPQPARTAAFFVHAEERVNFMSVPVAFTGVILIWSTTPLAIQWSSEGGGFLFGVTARMVLGLVFCVLAIRLSGVAMPWHARARSAYLAAGAGIYGAMLLVYWGAQFVPSGWIAVLFGLSPLITSVFSSIWLAEQNLTGRKVAGLSLGVLGLAVIFGGGAELGPNVAPGVVAVLLSTVLHSASAVWVRRWSFDLPAIAVTGGGLSIAVPAFILTWFVFDGVWPAMLPDRTRFAIVYLALFGSVLGFFWYFYLLRRLDAVKVNLLTLVTPVTALLLGHWLNGEALVASIWFGTFLILGGLSLHQWDQRRR